jgi:hypothetical protein
MEPREKMIVFDYQVSRFVVGIIAFALPIVVSFISWPVSSISASYWTGARDEFVGMLFIVGAFLMAYNGHTTGQSRASKVASLAAILVALFPTNCNTCNINPIAIVHYCSATTLFSILAYFCLGPFSKKADDKEKGGKSKKARRRKIIYKICGIIMIVCLVTVGISLAAKIGSEVRIIYWAEAVALAAFGVAWMTASKPIKFLAEEGELLFKKELKVGS